MEKIKLYFKRHKDTWPLLYVFIYMPWFIILENTFDTIDEVTLMYSPLDDIIPFCEAFIIPYMLWFLYVPLIFIIIYFSSTKEFYRLCAYEFTGMTIALLICTFFPNGHDLRVDLASRDNIFMTLVSFIYSNDTSTNVCPSIHVFATLSAHICLCKSPQIKVRPYIRPISGILAVLICMSTVLLKQHSIIDSICGILLAVILYFVVFKWWFRKTEIPVDNRDKHQVLWWLKKK